jgi:hypothetical protein
MIAAVSECSELILLSIRSLNNIVEKREKVIASINQEQKKKQKK